MKAWTPDSVDAVTWSPEMVTFARRAAEIGLSFAPRVELGTRLNICAEAVRRGRLALSAGGTLYIAPAAGGVAAVGDWVNRHPALAEGLAVTTPSELRRAMIAAGAAGFADRATFELDRRFPEMSARKVVRARQAVPILLLIGAAISAIILDPAGVATAVGFIATLFFLTVSALRFTAASLLQRNGLAEIAAGFTRPPTTICRSTRCWCRCSAKRQW